MNYSEFACPECRYFPLFMGNEYLQCPACNTSYPIHNSVPLLLPQENISTNINGNDHSLAEVQEIYNKVYKHDGLMGTDLDAMYDRVTKTILLEFADPLEGKRLLDVGTGIGRLWDYAPETVLGYALDLSIVGVSKAIECHPDLTVSASVGEHLPYPDMFFDVVIAADTIEHTFSPIDTMSEIYRVLKPSGIFCASFPIPDLLRKWGWNQIISHNFNPKFLFDLASVLWNRFRLFGTSTFQPIDRDLDIHAWVDMVENAGFIIQQITEWPAEPQVPIVYLIHANKNE